MIQHLYKLLFVLISFLTASQHQILLSQGVPFIESFTKEDYGYGTQNWDIIQLSNGLIYFANNNGMLEFDGSDWKIHYLPNKTICRSLELYDGNIYAGGQNEFGRFIRNKSTAEWSFESLVKKIPKEYRNFEDVWNIEILENRVYFRASGKVYCLENDSCNVLDLNSIQFLAKAGNQLLAQDDTGKLFSINNQHVTRIENDQVLWNTEITSIKLFNNSTLISTRKDGLFQYNDSIITPLKLTITDNLVKDQINDMELLEKGEIVIGTSFNGLYILDNDGSFKYKLDKNDGLSNNKIISLAIDSKQNLWAGSDNGISIIQLNSPFTQIFPDGELKGTGYDVKIYNNKIYFGTGNGLYSTEYESSFSEDDFNLVKNSDGQVWGLDLIDNRLLLSHNDGAFTIENNIANKIYSKTGVWLFKKDNKDLSNTLIGTYEGISIIDDKSLLSETRIPELEESSRFIEQDNDGNIWMSHPYRGIYKIDKSLGGQDLTVSLYGMENGLPSDFQNHVFKINEEILICSEKGVYNYDDNKEKFIPYDALNEYLGTDIKTRRLFESPNGDIWFITEEEIGVLEIEKKGLERTIVKKVFPQIKNLLNGGHEKIYPYDRENVFITTVNGFLHYNPNYDSIGNSSFNILLKELRINKDSIIYKGLDNILTKQSLTFNEFEHFQNNLRFTFAATDFIDNNAIQFQYFLEGYDDDWSPLSALRTKEYTNLPPEDYELNVKAVNISGEWSQEYKYSFIINPPWYLSTLAWIMYGILFFAGSFLVYSKVKKEYQELEQIIDTTIKKSEEEIQRLETEAIKTELDHRTRELVTATMHLIKKNETITNISSKLSEVKKTTEDSKTKRQIEKLAHYLKAEEVIDEAWEQFTFHFNELHEGFFESIKESYPAVTPKDLKLCAYLKMNLSTKEIATLMNITLRGVEASRYRLRKKLNLAPESNLTEFFMAY